MVVKLRLKQLFLYATLISIAVFAAPAAYAGTYIVLAPAQIKIKTDPGSTKPSVIDFRIGYEIDEHKFELAVMSSMNDDSLNELVTDIPSVRSVFYRYNPDPRSSVKLEFILGYSQVEIESTYINVPTSSETFEGVSYGIGLEEALQSIPQLKFKVDLIQMYKGDDLDLRLLSVGFRYEF